MSTFLIRSATSQSRSYPIVLTRLGGPRSRPNPHLKFVEVPGIEPATSWSVVRSIIKTFPFSSLSFLCTSIHYNFKINSWKFVYLKYFPYKLYYYYPLLIKTGAAPVHSWFPRVIQGLSWRNCFILITVQKIAPLILIYYLINFNVFLYTLLFHPF